jgi:hypothetical protein
LPVVCAVNGVAAGAGAPAGNPIHAQPEARRTYPLILRPAGLGPCTPRLLAKSRHE